MSLLGKILAIINVLAAAAFIYFAASDYGKRQQWSHAVYRHDLAINGLPLDDNQKDVDGNLLAKNLNQTTLNEIFQGAGTPVSTQQAEVQNVKKAVIDKINGEAMTVANPWNNQPLALDTPEKRRAWFMLPFATSLSDRDLRVSQMMGGNPPVDEAAIEQLFTNFTVRESAGDKQQGYANLLFGLLEPGESDLFESQAFKRFVAVVGRKAAATAIDNQAAGLTQLARETNDALAAGRATFAAAHAREVMRLRDLAGVLQREKETLELQRNQTARQKDLVNDRKRQVNDLENQLEKGRKTTRALLAEQERVEKALIEQQRWLRDANSKNQGLEKQIGTREK
jgi:hypothetical protein